MTKPTIMIQARVGSTRFPKKVLAKIENKPMIWHVIERVKRVKGIEQIILVTTRNKEDDVLLSIAKKCGIIGFKGDVNNVLSRFYQCAIKYDADPIIRITGDCPLIDPSVIEKMVDFYNTHYYDYVTNILIPSFPDGLDTEVFSFNVLKKMFQKAKLRSEREHVTAYIRNHIKEFKIFNYTSPNPLPIYRWTVDEPADLKFIKKIYARMRPLTIFSTERVMKIISKNPKILEINSGLVRNEGYFLSLKNDKKLR